jgi:hypothetical protein
MARIVLNHSPFRKRNPSEPGKRPLRLFEIARLLVRFNHVARFILNANHQVTTALPFRCGTQPRSLRFPIRRERKYNVKLHSTRLFAIGLIGFIGFVLCVASAWAGPSSIQGIVKDAKGQPIKGADVRIESKDGKQLFNTVKTDVKGRYISQGLAPGVYRVTLMVNGAVKGSIMNTKTKPDQATQLNFDLKAVSASQASTATKSGKHMVWMPPTTGSHTGGRWVEVPDGAAEPGTLNVKKVSAEELQRAAQSMSQKPSGQ